MKHQSVVFAFLLVVLTIPAWSGANAQDSADRPAVQTLSVFLDCNGPNCDRDHFRREIEWVNWARDRQDADVHLLITMEMTGGNGWHYTLDYIGLRSFDGVDKSLSHTSVANDTDAETRDALTQTMAVGLVQYAEATAVAPRLRIAYRAAREGAEQAQLDEHDPWNLWMFRLSMNGSIEGEAQQSEYSIGGSASADRVTEEMKVNFNLFGDYTHERWERTDDTVVNVRENYTANLLMVWSLGEQWSFGGKANADRSSRENRDLAVSVGPAIEYDFFPYSESTRRSVTLRYAAEVVSFNYNERTIEDETDEILPRHSLTLSAAIQQPWGDIRGSIEAIQYLHALKTHRINTSGRIEYRLFRGLNLNLGGEFSRIKDQFYLSAVGLDDDDILTERLERETDFSYELRIGFSVVFGSKFANIVNPRMGGGRRMFFGRR